ncbi:MAG: hypothetical protein EAX86_09090 [Candidatus Heimdallarchaeota archaeon]|nr:hypothetical protein [Candidatus Heimdallarchaeota archaeon]
MINASVGLFINHDLNYATQKALEQAEAKLDGDPSLILYFTGTHLGGSQTYDRALRIIKQKYPRIPLAGCSGIGICDKHDYGLKGAGILLVTGITARTSLIKRFRIGTSLKARKIRRNCNKINRIEKKRGSNTTFLFFPPGLGFPKFLINLLNHKIEGFNPFFPLNNRIWRLFPLLSKLSGKFAGFAMDIAGIGISYSAAWPLFSQLYEDGIHFTGTFGTDPLTMNKSYQFSNFKAYKDSLVYVSISSPFLHFTSQTDSGAQIIPQKTFDLDSYLNGGFIPRIRKKWGKLALLELFDMEKTPEILEECIQRYFYYHPFRPLCVIDNSNNQNIYCLAVNPNLNHALITAPNQVAKQLIKTSRNRLNAYICDQSSQTIESLLKETLSKQVSKNTLFGLFFDCGNRAMIIGDRFDQYSKVYADNLNIPYLVVISGGEINSQTFPIVNMSLISSLAHGTINSP